MINNPYSLFYRCLNFKPEKVNLKIKSNSISGKEYTKLYS